MPILRRQLTGNERAAQQREAARRRLDTTYQPTATRSAKSAAKATSMTVKTGAAPWDDRRQTAQDPFRQRNLTNARIAGDHAQTAAGAFKSASTTFVACIKASIAAAATILLLQTVASAVMGTGNPIWLLLPIDKVGAIFMGPFFALSLVVPIIMVARVVQLTGLSGQAADIATGVTVLSGPFLMTFAAQPLSDKGLTMLSIALAGAVGGYTFWKARTPKPTAA